MLGVLGSSLGNSFLYGHAEWIKTRNLIFLDKIKDMAPNSASHMFVWGNHAFAMVYPHMLREWAWLRAHINVMTITQFVQKCNVGGLLALYGSTMHVATL